MRCATATRSGDQLPLELAGEALNPVCKYLYSAMAAWMDQPSSPPAVSSEHLRQCVVTTPMPDYVADCVIDRAAFRRMTRVLLGRWTFWKGLKVGLFVVDTPNKVVADPRVIDWCGLREVAHREMAIRGRALQAAVASLVARSGGGEGWW